MPVRRVKRVAGFTLLEMIVAITIFGILVAVTVPTMRTWISNSKVRAVADNLQTGLRLAQAESLRRSRQVVFALTNSTTPQNGAFTAVANGTNWAIMVVPAMAGAFEANPANMFVESGSLSVASGNIQVTGPAEVCFNSVGRLVANNTTGVAGANCAVPGNLIYKVQIAGADPALRALQVMVSVGGQVHMCDPQQTLSNTNPYGC
jgi:type IV fimbrial biogenesis protein FimT